MFLYGGRVREVQAVMAESVPRLVALCAQHHRERNGRPPEPSEEKSWRRSWPELLNALTRAGLDEFQLFLEYELLGCSQRVDAVLLGARPGGGMAAVVVELKQWTSCSWASRTLATVLNREYTHPSRQAAGYVSHFRKWLDEPELDLELRAVALLHAAPAEVVDKLRDAVSGSAGSAEVSLMGRDDLRPERSSAELAGSLRCHDLLPPEDEQIERFVSARYAPAPSLFDELADVLAGDPAYRLVGAQQDAQLSVLDTVVSTAPDGKHVVVVRGGPGTGKTVIAARLLADIARTPRSSGNVVPARFVTPSGTLRSQLERAAVSVAGSKALFANLGIYAGRPQTHREVVLVDEAQRMNRRGRHMEMLLRRGPVCVFFLDERQIIRPGEGFTADEMEAEANRLGATFTKFDLTSQFRCGGSQYYLNWLEQLFHGKAEPWQGSDYDVDVARDPVQLEDWISAHVSSGSPARITAGFCWEWPREVALNEDVKVRWKDAAGAEHTWRRPWNSEDTVRDDDEILAPRKEFWATDPGGHEQVGCIYTSQGLEYEYGGVIMGPDLVRRGDHWEAHPELSEDPKIKGKVTAEEYMRLAANIYWVLASRGKRGCRLYSADAETQRFLESLFVAH